jgi:hypothetical protein
MSRYRLTPRGENVILAASVLGLAALGLALFTGVFWH